MALSFKQKLPIIPLLLYWPTIFILTLILENIPHLSDKTLHYLAYLILVFLLWFAVSPNKRANWRRTTVWWVLLVTAGYGAFDEWLQGYVGRQPDIMDFAADLAAVLTGLILLSLFQFWPASLILTGAAILVLTNLMQVNLAGQQSLLNAIFHLFAYVIFSLLWIRYMCDLALVKAPAPKWLIGAFAMPTIFLLGVESFSAITSGGFRLQDIIISAIGIITVVSTVFLTALLRQGFAQKPEPNGT
jgi:VanZ family protein